MLLLNIEDYRRKARAVLPRFVHDYIEGSADDGHCMRRNAGDLSAIELTPRVLRDTTQVDTSIEVFGRKWALPIGIAPTGLNGLVRPDGDRLLAVAAAEAGIPFSLSTASNMRLEDVRAAAPGGVQWMQLYVMHREMASQIVERAQKGGYQALVLTVDVPVSGNRELDLRNGFRMPFRPTPRLAWDLVSHPRWSLRMAPRGAPDFANLTPSRSGAGSTSMQAALLARAMDRSLVWESLAWLRGMWKGPLLLKGVLHPDDARMALDHGIDGLIVSNHGGRQNDASPSAISALPRVVNAVAGRIPVFMDGGIRRGGDVAKALALGATAVFVGRPTLYGLAVGGQQGASAVLKILADELVRNMTLLGATTVRDLPARRLAVNASGG
ncbi:(S)-mandelate dehydrogenase [Variovorax sp. SG517]|nr:(S)-mandelate dehydrogenase [Variovorax sp. SG517]